MGLSPSPFLNTFIMSVAVLYMERLGEEKSLDTDYTDQNRHAYKGTFMKIAMNILYLYQGAITHSSEPAHEGVLVEPEGPVELSRAIAHLLRS
jgi:hypothetical protein